MVQLRSKFKRVMIRLLDEMNAQELRETADFALFLKTRARIDPSQAYFWTNRWQAMEQRVQQDKLRRRLLGNGSIDSLLRALKA